MQTSSPFSILEIHSNFKINKNSYDKEGLKDLAYRYCKEGELYEQEIGDFLLDWLNEKNYIIVQTSGSTGKPKKIKVFKEHMINSARATGSFFKVEEDTTALLCLSASYIAGKMMLVRAMVLGWKIDLTPPVTNPLDSIYKQYDFCAMVPLQLDNSLNRLHLIKKLIVGGGAISSNLKELVQGIKTKVYETYGMTETVSHVAARRVNPKKKEIGSFKALPAIKLNTDDRDCLIINAPLLHKDVIYTNDIVELKTYKKFIWKGRYDNVINSGGVKLFPEEIETKLQPLIEHRFFVTSLPDDKLGNKLILLIEQYYDKAAIISLQECIDQLSTLGAYETPKEIYFYPKFVVTENGKLQRKETLQFVIDHQKLR